MFCLFIYVDEGFGGWYCEKEESEKWLLDMVTVMGKENSQISCSIRWVNKN